MSNTYRATRLRREPQECVIPAAISVNQFNPRMTRRRFLGLSGWTGLALGTLALAGPLLVRGDESVETAKKSMQVNPHLLEKDFGQDGGEIALAHNALIESFYLGEGLFSEIPQFPFPGSAWSHVSVYREVNLLWLLLEGNSDFGERTVATVMRGAGTYWNERFGAPGYGPNIDINIPGLAEAVIQLIGGKWSDDPLWIILANFQAEAQKNYFLLNKGARAHFPALGREIAAAAARDERFYQQLLQQNWDTQEGGGIYLHQRIPGQADPTRATCSNAPAIQVALRFRNRHPTPLQKQADLAQAEAIYAWMQTYLRNPDQTYRDAIAGKLSPNTPVAPNQINTTLFTYNQGTALGAGLMLYLATGNEADLHEAEATASASLHHFGQPQEASLDHHPLLLDEAPNFVSIYVRNLAALSEVTQEQDLRNAIRTMIVSYAERFETNPTMYDNKSHLVRFDHPNFQKFYIHPLAVQAAFVEILVLATLIKKGKLNQENCLLLF